MALTPEQVNAYRQKYNLGGTAPSGGAGTVGSILGITSGTKPKEVGFVSDTLQDISQTGSDIGDTLKGTFGQGGTVSKALGAGIDGEQGILRSFGQAFGLGAGGVAKGIGDLFTGAIKTILPQGAEEAVKSKIESVATPIVESAVSIPAVQQFITDYQSLDEKSKRDVDALFGIGSLATELATSGVGSPVKKAAQEVVEQGVKGAGRVAAPVVNAAGRVASAVSPTVEGVKDVALMAAESASRIPNRIAVNVAEKQATRDAVKNLPSKIAQQAAQDGVDIADIRQLVNIPKVQKGPVKKVVKAVQDFASGASKTRPEEIVGKPITAAVKRLDAEARKVGQRLGEVSKKLGVVTSDELVTPVFDALKKVPGLNGIAIKNGVLDFKNTVLTTAETAADRKAIQSIFSQATKWGKGESKHRLRQELFEILGGKKRSLSNLTDTQEKAYQAIREGLSNVLEGKNPLYKKLSNDFRKKVQPLGELRKFMRGVAGADEDIVDMASGLLARRLTSNAASNPQLRSILRAMDNALKTKGKTLVNVENLQDVYNILDKYYDIAAKTGFQGQIKSGVDKVSGGLSDAVTKAVGGFTGETPAVRQRALERLLMDILK